MHSDVKEELHRFAEETATDLGIDLIGAIEVMLNEADEVTEAFGYEDWDLVSEWCEKQLANQGEASCTSCPKLCS